MGAAMQSFELKPEEVKGFWSGRKPSPDIILAAQFQSEIMERVEHQAASAGEPCPIIPRFRLRKGELTIWAGGNGDGKSAMMSQIALSMMMRGDSICMLSFEMEPQSTILQMIRMAYGRRLSPNESGKVEKFFDWCEKRFWIYRNRGAIDPAYALDAVAYAAAVKGCAHVFVDNLMMLTGGDNSDQLYQTQRYIVEQLKRIAVDCQTHIHVVAHLRKPSSSQSMKSPPGRYEISGSSDISNLADNVAVVTRNRDKENEAERLQTKNVGWDKEADTLIKLDKQRENGQVIWQKLWFEKKSGQFCLSPERQLMELMPKNLSGADLTRSHQADALNVAEEGWL